MEVIASLPCYTAGNTDAQRGDGVFAQSIAALRKLNAVGLMCRSTLSVGWREELFDCDFNQMLGLQPRGARPLFLWDVTPADLEGRAITTGPHRLACTAGGGSSCTAATDLAGTVRGR